MTWSAAMDLHWLSTYSDVITNCLDFAAFVLVTPDLIGSERLARMQIWMADRSRHTDHASGRFFLRLEAAGLCLAVVYAAVWLASKALPSGFWSWLDGLPVGGPVSNFFQIVVLDIFFLAPFIIISTALAFSPVAALYLFDYFAERVLNRWKISGVFLVAGAFLFLLSRMLSVCHALYEAS
jgi:hypothetical protein